MSAVSSANWLHVVSLLMHALGKSMVCQEEQRSKNRALGNASRNPEPGGNCPIHLDPLATPREVPGQPNVGFGFYSIVK